MHEICLGITSYVTLLISLILEQIPSELKIIISGRFKYDDWDSLNLFEIFEEELFTREIIEMIGNTENRRKSFHCFSKLLLSK